MSDVWEQNVGKNIYIKREESIEENLHNEELHSL
jgi:hypothetical protein